MPQKDSPYTVLNDNYILIRDAVRSVLCFVIDL